MGSVKQMKRHSIEEIELKLRQASELMARGQNQAQICKSLGISIMTFHRWRAQQAQPTAAQAPSSTGHPEHPSLAGDQNDQPTVNLTISDIPSANLLASLREASVQELIEENRRLKKIVTDLLLEKIKLEEAEQANKSSIRLTREPQHRTLPRTR